MRDDFYGFYRHFRNNDLVHLEDRAIKQIIFNALKCTCIIFFKVICFI